jgi:hypothetical protein
MDGGLEDWVFYGWARVRTNHRCSFQNDLARRPITADARGWILGWSEEESGFCTNYMVLGGVNGNERGEGGHIFISFRFYVTLRFKSLHS